VAIKKKNYDYQFIVVSKNANNEMIRRKQFFIQKKIYIGFFNNTND